MTTTDTTAGVVLTGDNLATARQFVDRAIISAAGQISDNPGRWPEVTPDAPIISVDLAAVFELARLNCIGGRLAETDQGEPWKPLTPEMTATIRRAAHQAIAYARLDDGSDADWSRQLTRDAYLAGETLAALDGVEAGA